MATTYIGVVRKGKIEVTPPVTLPEGSQVHLVLSVIINERTARRKANRWLIENVGNMVMAHNAEMVQMENQAIWRFEAVVTGSTHAPVGPIGYVDVDARTGKLLSNRQTARTMIERGQHFKDSLLPAES